ncbi:MAG: WxcM-like domain-containing protein [Ichthyobacteriaceae bacterium]|nr:WxcM-like domain-containing protein [Ichthyobacteriaceae bacterium]
MKGSKIILREFKESRGDLFVIEEDFNINLGFENYYILNNETEINTINQSDILIVLRGEFYIDDEILQKGDAIKNVNNIGVIYVSDDFIGLILSNYNHLYSKINNINFSVKRIFFVDNMPVGSVRGQHAHKVETEFLFSANGLFDVETKFVGEFSGVINAGESVVSLPNAYTTVTSLTKGGILLAFLSHKYDASGFTYSNTVVESNLELAI